MTAVDNATRQTKTTANAGATSPFQKITYVVGVQLVAWIFAFNLMFMFYGTSYIWWWPHCLGLQILFILSTQFMPEAIAGTNWSKIDWELVLDGAVKYTVVFCIGSPLIWFHVLKVHECADLKGPMQYFCTQEGGKQASVFYTPDHDGNSWNTNTVAWLLFVPMLVLKMSVYDIIFDFVYYMQHRLWHEVPWLYRHCHKTHHTLSDPQKTGEDPLSKSWHTTKMTIFEVALIELMHVPCMAIMIYVFGSNPLARITALDGTVTFAYGQCVEFFGHNVHPLTSSVSAMPAGNIIKAVSGFAPIRACDHALHHELVTCNYGKRTMLWDSIFGSWIFGSTETPERKERLDFRVHGNT